MRQWMLGHDENSEFVSPPVFSDFKRDGAKNPYPLEEPPHGSRSGFRGYGRWAVLEIPRLGLGIPIPANAGWGMEHHVYFWLKDEFKDDAGRARMEAALDELAKSPNVSKAHWGTPAPTEERPVTDHSWDYGISFHFDTMEAHAKYQKADPVHDAFSGGHKEMWAKVMVMDLS